MKDISPNDQVICTITTNLVPKDEVKNLVLQASGTRLTVTRYAMSERTYCKHNPISISGSAAIEYMHASRIFLFR
jgi:hypothetical protein